MEGEYRVDAFLPRRFAIETAAGPFVGGVLGIGFPAINRQAARGLTRNLVAAATEASQDALLSASSLTCRQLAVHEALTESGAMGLYRKRSVSMSDLRAITRGTGDEYSMYTQGGRRFIIRVNRNKIRVTPEMAEALSAGMFGRWSTSNWLSSPVERISKLALPNNQATRAASVQLQPGTTVFQGVVAPQLKYGGNLTGGALQTYNAAGPRAIITEIFR